MQRGAEPQRSGKDRSDQKLLFPKPYLGSSEGTSGASLGAELSDGVDVGA